VQRKRQCSICGGGNVHSPTCPNRPTASQPSPLPDVVKAIPIPEAGQARVPVSLSQEEQTLLSVNVLSDLAESWNDLRGVLGLGPSKPDLSRIEMTAGVSVDVDPNNDDQVLVNIGGYYTFVVRVTEVRSHDPA
jgi:hypothetical protein